MLVDNSLIGDLFPAASPQLTGLHSRDFLPPALCTPSAVVTATLIPSSGVQTASTKLLPGETPFRMMAAGESDEGIARSSVEGYKYLMLRGCMTGHEIQHGGSGLSG